MLDVDEEELRYSGWWPPICGLQIDYVMFSVVK